MSDERMMSGIESALFDLARADRTLDEVERLLEDEGGDDEGGGRVAPWEAAHVWIARAMCLLVDSLDGVKGVEFSPAESIPVAQTVQPYTGLLARYEDQIDRCQRLAQEHKDGGLWGDPPAP